MSKQLYEEALADVKSLKAVAEDNAKKALVEAVTPRIRDLIEKQLLKEFYEDELGEDEDLLGVSSVGDDSCGDEEFDYNDSLPPAMPAPGSAPKGNPRAPLLTDNQESGQKEIVIDLGNLSSLASLAQGIGNDDEGFDYPKSPPPTTGDILGFNKLVSGVAESTKRLVKNESFARSGKGKIMIQELLTRVENMYEYMQETVMDPAKKQSFENSLETYYALLNKLQEQNNMRSRNRRSLNEDNLTIMFSDVKLPKDSSMEEVFGDSSAEISFDEPGDDDMDDMEDEEGGDDEGFELEGGDDEDEGMDDESEDAAGDDDEGFDLEGGDDDEEEEVVTAGMNRESRNRARRGDNVIVEIDEGMLRREIGKMKMLREARARRARIISEKKNASFKAPSNKGHGAGKLRDHDDLGDPILDIDLNELSEALSRETRSVSRRGAYRNGASNQVAESTKLRNKLAETNLFNAKLVYSNKLLQNESLSKRQKAEIIERLDEARNIREVKLVYESLVKTMAGTSRPLRESNERRVLGSSSRATRPASTTLTEGFETDRWARLAGIIK
jgi:hypothetical protein